MEKTGVVINRDSWLLLQDEPFYSARFIDRDGTDELALVVRVEELEGVEEIVHFGEIQSFHDRCQEWLTRIRFSVVSHFEIFSPRRRLPRLIVSSRCRLPIFFGDRVILLLFPPIWEGQERQNCV